LLLFRFNDGYKEFVEKMLGGGDGYTVEDKHFMEIMKSYIVNNQLKACYLDSIITYIESIECALNGAFYFNVFMEQKTTTSCSIYSDKTKVLKQQKQIKQQYKILRPMKLIYPTKENSKKTVNNSINIILRKPDKSQPFLYHAETITNLNKMFKVISKEKGERDNLYVCPGCLTTYLAKSTFYQHIKKCTPSQETIKTSENLFLKYNTHQFSQHGCKPAFHMTFDVETTSKDYLETREQELEEMEQSKTLKTENIRRLILHSYSIHVFFHENINIKNFTIYRSLGKPETIRFHDTVGVPEKVKHFIHPEDKEYREQFDRDNITEKNFSSVLVADLNWISYAALTYINDMVVPKHMILNLSGSERDKIASDTVKGKKPCIICKSEFASYENQKEMCKGGLSKKDLRYLIKCEYEQNYRFKLLNETVQGQTNDTFINFLIDEKEEKHLDDLLEYVKRHLLVDEILTQIRKRMHGSIVDENAPELTRPASNAQDSEKQLFDLISKVHNNTITFDNEEFQKGLNLIATCLLKALRSITPGLNKNLAQSINSFLDNWQYKTTSDIYNIVYLYDQLILLLHPREQRGNDKNNNIRFIKSFLLDLDGDEKLTTDEIELKFVSKLYQKIQNIVLQSNYLVIHHDHITGEVYGLAHSSCNLQVRQHGGMRNVNIFSHNATFDLFYVIEGMLKNLTSLRGRDYSQSIKPIGNTLDKIRMIFNVGHMTFKDSYQMFADSLDNLAKSMNDDMKNQVINDFVEYLISSDIWKNMKIMQEQFNFIGTIERRDIMNIFEELLNKADCKEKVLRNMLTIPCRDYLFEKVNNKDIIQKAPFPYESCQTIEYMTKERTSFPDKEDFNSLLKQKGVSNSEYEYGKNIWNVFGLKTVEQYNEIYNVLDSIITSVYVGLSSEKLYKEIGLDIRTFTSMCQFSSTAMLMLSRAIPQVPNSQTAYELTTQGIRAGPSFVNKRYAFDTSCLTKEQWEKDCDLQNGKKMATCVVKIDENNQYGGAQAGLMPYIGFLERKGMSIENVLTLLQIIQVKNTSSTGYGFIGRFDLYIPDKKHDENLFYTPSFQKREPRLQWLGPLQLKNLREPYVNNKDKFKMVHFTEKLISTLFELQSYSCSYKMLQHLLDCGWILTKVWDLVEFKMEDYVRGYVVENQNVRMATHCDVEKKLRKDMNNVSYGSFTRKPENYLNQEFVYSDIDSIEQVRKIASTLGKQDPHKNSATVEKERIDSTIKDLQTQHKEKTITDFEYEVQWGKLRDEMEDVVLLESNENYADGQSYSYILQPKSEVEYKDIDTKVFEQITDVNTRQIKNLDSNYSNGSVKIMVAKENKNKHLKTLRANAVMILDNAKISMSNCNKQIKAAMKMNGICCHLIGSDTDSGFYNMMKEVDTYEENLAFLEEVENILHVNCRHLLDYSNYPKDHKFYDCTHRKEFFYFQNEHPPPQIVSEILASGPKEYLIAVVNKEDEESNSTQSLWEKRADILDNNVRFDSNVTKEGVIRKHKGISTKHRITRIDYQKRIQSFDEYLDNENEGDTSNNTVDVYSFRTDKGKRKMAKTTKKKLSKLTDKVYVFHDGINTCNFGHYRLRPIVELNESVSYDTLFSDNHLTKLLELEKRIINEWPDMNYRINIQGKIEKKFLNQ